MWDTIESPLYIHPAGPSRVPPTSQTITPRVRNTQQTFMVQLTLIERDTTTLEEPRDHNERDTTTQNFSTPLSRESAGLQKKRAPCNPDGKATWTASTGGFTVNLVILRP